MPFEIPISPSYAKNKKIHWGKTCEWHAEVILENWGLELRTLNDASKLFFDKDNPLTFTFLVELDRMSCEHKGKGRAVVAALMEETNGWPHRRRFVGSLIVKRMREKFQGRKFATGNFQAGVDGDAMATTKAKYEDSAPLHNETRQGDHSITEPILQLIPFEPPEVSYEFSPEDLQAKQLDSSQEERGERSMKSESKQDTSHLAKLQPGPETLTVCPHFQASTISNQYLELEPKPDSAQALISLPYRSHSAPANTSRISTRHPDHIDPLFSLLSKIPMKRKHSDGDLGTEFSASWEKEGGARKRSALGKAMDSVGERRC